MGIHEIPRVHQALLILCILQSSVVCEDTNDWVEKGPHDKEPIPTRRSGSHHHYQNHHHHKGHPQVGPQGRAAGAMGHPPQLQDPTYMAKVHALMEQIKAKKPQAFERAKSYLPKSFHLPESFHVPETVNNLWNNYGWGRKAAPKPLQAPRQPTAPSGSRLLRQVSYWKKRPEGLHVDPLPVEPDPRVVPLQWQDETDTEIPIQDESNQPAPQDWDRPQPIAEAQPQAQYLPDLIPPQQYGPPVQEEPIPYADQGLRPPPAEKYEYYEDHDVAHDEHHDDTTVYDHHEQDDNHHGQDYDHPGMPEHHEYIEDVHPQPQNFPPPDYETQQDYKSAYESAHHDQDFYRHRSQTHYDDTAQYSHHDDTAQYAHHDDIDEIHDYPQTYDPSINLANPPPNPAYETPMPEYESPKTAYEPPRPAYETPEPSQHSPLTPLIDPDRPLDPAPVGKFHFQSWHSPSPANDYGFRRTPHAEPPPRYGYGSGGDISGGYGSGYGDYGSGNDGYSSGSSGYSNSGSFDSDNRSSGYIQYDPDGYLAYLKAILNEPE